VGGLIGGIAGSIVGFFQADDYSGIVQQLAGLPEERKDVLLSEVRSALTRAGATAKQFESAEAFRGALTEYASQPTVRDQIWRACVHAMKNEN
jgi:predicted component of type VI protein secretion system